MLFLAHPALQLIDWEKEIFPKEKVVPCLVFYDLKNERTIVMNYTIIPTAEDVCPLLVDGLCMRYEERPLICRKYPCPYENVHETEISGVLHSPIKHCMGEPPLEKLNEMLGLLEKPKISNAEFMKRLYARYGDGFLYGLMADSIGKVHTEFLVSMEKQGLIKLARPGYDMKALVTKIKKNPSIDLSQLFEQHMHFSLKRYLEKEPMGRLREDILTASG